MPARNPIAAIFYLRRACIAFALLLSCCIACPGVAASPSPKQTKTTLAATLPSPHTPKTPKSDAPLPQVELINREIRAGWKQADVAPSPRATDAEWCRRVYLDVLGRIPSVIELQTFLDERPRGRRERLVDRLLSKEYEKDYTRNWTVIWSNLLVGRRGQMPDIRRMVDRDGLQKYLLTVFKENKPYDKFVYELLTATGNNNSQEPNFNGATNFLSGKLEDRAIEATARSSQLFLGVQVQCTQCHDHPFNDKKQSQFWEMNAFFQQAHIQKNGRPKRPDNVVLGDRNRRELSVTYDKHNGSKATAFPVFLDGTKIDVQDRPNGREEFARLVTASPLMREAIVNRMWAHFFGSGFSKPIDDIGPHNEPTHATLIKQLGEEFGKSGFNSKQLIRWIVLSEPYALSSRTTPRNRKDEPSQGQKPMFSHFYTRRMRAEEIYQSLIVATEFDRTIRMIEQIGPLEDRWLDQFGREFGFDGSDETAAVGGTIPQALMMFNGDATRRATHAGQGGTIDQVLLKGGVSNAERIEYLYMAALARRPTAVELTMANNLLVANKGNIRPALEDVWWALLNSNQFILNY